GSLNFEPGFGAQPVAAQAHDVDPVRLRRIPLHQHVRGDILGDHAVGAHHRHPSDLGKLVDPADAADYRPILDDHMAGDAGGVGDPDVVADLDVVGDVDVRHHQVVIADPGLSAAALRPAADGGVLPDDV